MKLRNHSLGSSTLRRRLMLAGGGMAALAAVGYAGFSGTSALFDSSAPSQTATFAAGTVTLTSPSTQTCTIKNLAPGTEGASSQAELPGSGNQTTASQLSPLDCQYQVSYSGSLRAWILLDVSVTSSAANPTGGTSTTGTEALYDGTSSGLQLGVLGGPTSSPTDTFSVGTATCKAGTSSTPQSCTSSAADQLVGQGPVSNGWTGTFNLDSYFPTWADNIYQGGTATVTLTAHAVQYANNHSSDCYNYPCLATAASGDPIINGVSASAGGSTMTLDYSQPVTLPGYSSGALGSNSSFTVTDWNQSSSTRSTCPVTNIKGSGTSTLTLTLGQCSNGSNIAANDLLTLYYNTNSSAPNGVSGPFVVSVASAGTSNLAYAPSQNVMVQVGS